MIEDKAKDLGRTIGQSPEYKEVKRASDTLNEDRETVSLLQQMEQLRLEAQRMLQRGERPNEEMERKRDTLLSQIQSKPSYQRLLEAPGKAPSCDCCRSGCSPVDARSSLCASPAGRFSATRFDGSCSIQSPTSYRLPKRFCSWRRARNWWSACCGRLSRRGRSSSSTASFSPRTRIRVQAAAFPTPISRPRIGWRRPA